jgi:predicted permease
MVNILRSLPYAARQLRNAPAFTITAILTLALGIGATTAIFSAVYGLLLKSLPFADAGRIVAIASTHALVPGSVEATFPDFEDWRAQQSSFSEIAAYSTINPSLVSLSYNGHAEPLHRVLASGNFFSVLGVSPLLGRTLNASDDTQGSAPVGLLSFVAWQRYFSSDPGTVGRSVDIDGASVTIVGILPSGAAFPADGEIWLPLSRLPSGLAQATRVSRVWHSVKVIGRLKPGVELPAARVDMHTIATRLATAYPATDRNSGIELTPLREQLVGSLRPAMLTLLAAVVLVLLIACANVANLLLIRANASRRQVAIRQALGASRAQLFSESLAQTLLLCLLGGILGTALAAGALPLLRVALAHTATLDPAMLQSVSLSLPVLALTFATCTLTALLFGLLPALQRTTSLPDALRAGDRSNSGRQTLSRAALIATEIAIAVVVLFLGTLVLRSYQKLLAVDPGFRTDHLLSAEITLPQPRYADSSPATDRFFHQLLDRLAQTPGILHAATTTQTPLKPSQVMTRFLIQGAPALAPGTYPFAQMRSISPAYFETMGLRLRDGRAFTQKDIDQQANVMMVNNAFAQRYLAGRNPVGSTVLLGVMTPNPDKIPVIGVVDNARDLGVNTDPEPEIYFPGYGLHEVVLLRTNVDAEGLIPILRSAIQTIDPGQPIYNVETTDALLADSLARQRMTALLLGLFAAVALALAAIGIYGVLSYSVAQRTREIGVRMAIGANRAHVLQLILIQAARFTVLGLAAGLAASLLGARIMTSQLSGLLFHTTSLDTSSIAIALGTLALIALVAAALPATRAASVNPAETLRAE